MKTLIVAGAVTFLAVGVLAQGQFTFGNKNLLSTPPVDAKVFRPDGTPLAGADYWAQAYVGTSLDSLAPVGSPVNFRTGSNAGYIVSQVVTTPFPGGTTVFVEMRAWEAGVNSYEAAIAGGKLYGKSDPIQLTVAEAPNPPPDMIGLKSFSLVPEPSTMALGLLGAAALLLRRRS
jgi:hypothetical protein